MKADVLTGPVDEHLADPGDQGQEFMSALVPRAVHYRPNQAIEQLGVLTEHPATSGFPGGVR